MKIYNLEVLDNFKKKHAQSRKKLDLWKCRIEENEYKTPNELADFFKYSNLSEGLVVFKDNNDYRIVACLNYERQSLFIKEILTHETYNEVKLKEKYNCLIICHTKS
ncbi:MAG: type II toxin-antitoxin system HigB family toxin [Bacteroidales bacterium]|nr:type II toxin-antitoxin system HigB family toxin [Bacteroidales bacterium]